MTNVIARIKAAGKNFEILVDVDKALAMKKGEEVEITEILEIDEIFSDNKKGERASEDDLKKGFGTTDVNEIAKKIIKQGEIQVPSEYREKQRGEKFKQVVDYFVKNATDPQSDRPYTSEKIESGLDQAGVNITNKPIESQIKEITEKLSVVMPIKIETKKLVITIPAQYTGQAYGLVQNYKESEEWLGNGDLKVVVNVPVGFQMEFYDKLNAVTHGAAVSEEVKENE